MQEQYRYVPAHKIKLGPFANDICAVIISKNILS